MIPIYKPYLSKEALKYAHDAVDSTWISSTGKYIELSTDFLKDILQVENLKLVNNGTSATHLAVKALLKKSPSIKEIVVPNNVYVAAWNSAIYERLRLHPVDANLDTWNVDLDKLESVLKTKDPQKTAVMVVPNLGNIINTRKLQRAHPDFLFIEDNCEGFYGKYEDHFSGTGCLASSLSFFGNKTITSGEGGAFITDDKEVYDFIDKVQGQGQSSQRYIHDVLGYNYRMTNIQAAILYGQLMILDQIVEKKMDLFDFYKDNLSPLVERGVMDFQYSEEDTVHSNWIFGLKCKNKCKKIREHLNRKGVDTRPMFYDITKHKHIVGHYDTVRIDNARSLQEVCFMIPSYPSISIEERAYVVDSIKDFFNE